MFKIFFRFKVEGQENLKGLENGPVIFASNHNSYIDGGIAGASLLKGSLHPKKFFPVRYLVGSEYFKWKYFPVNIFVMLVGSVKVKRAEIKKQTIVIFLNHCLGLLKRLMTEIKFGYIRKEVSIMMALRKNPESAWLFFISKPSRLFCR